MSLLLASNAFKLIDELNELSSMTMVDEFRLQRVYSDAQKLNELEDRYMITGIYYCLKNNPQLAFENLDAACKISQEFDVIDAYIKTSLKICVLVVILKVRLKLLNVARKHTRINLTK
jgi:hypothetical protein